MCLAIINHFIAAAAPRQARTGLRRVADSGQDPSLPLAGAHQAQEVLSQVQVNWYNFPKSWRQIWLIVFLGHQTQGNYLNSILSGLPPGFKLTEEILNAEKPTLPPPVNIHYNEKHVSVMWSLAL